MEDKKFIKQLILETSKYEVDTLREVNINNTHTFFEGTPKKHPNDDSILILLTNPFEKNKQFFEFSMDSIGKVEEIGTITSEEGKSAVKVRIWVRKGMRALKTEPFIIN